MPFFCKFATNWFLGVGVFVVALFGIFGNVATILALRRKKRSCFSCCISFQRKDSDISDNQSSIHRNNSFKSSINLNSSSIINMNDCFYKLLVGLAVVDVILISYIMVEISIIGVFMDEQPQWFKVRNFRLIILSQSIHLYKYLKMKWICRLLKLIFIISDRISIFDTSI